MTRKMMKVRFFRVVGITVFAVIGVCDMRPLFADIVETGSIGGGYIGVASPASVTVNNGSDLVGTYTDIGCFSEGAVTVVDPGSTWTSSSYLRVGSGSAGTLSIQNGAIVTSFNANNTASAYVGHGAAGVANVSGTGSSWTIGNDLYVGNLASGTLNISDHGTVSNGGNAYVGYGRYGVVAPGAVTIDGAGAAWTCGGTLSIGNLSAGSVTVSNGAVLSAHAVVGGVLRQGDAAGDMTLNLDGGILRAVGGPNSDWISLGAGSGSILVGAGGAQFDTNGFDMQINQPLSTNISNDGGISKLGDGTLTISGDVYAAGLTTVKGGTLVLGRLAQHAVFHSSGADIQHGRLVFDYSGGSAPFWEVTGALGTTIRSSSTDAGCALGWIDDVAQSRMIVAYTLLGDANCDLVVDFTDLTTLLSHYNQNWTVWADGDFDNNGAVDFSDLTVMLSHYNQGVAAAAATAAVPEPASLLLAAIAGILGLLAFRVQRRRLP